MMMMLLKADWVTTQMWVAWTMPMQKNAVGKKWHQVPVNFQCTSEKR